ncbi:hypothetical protein [Arthrobacter russicus]|uniref:PknH-like extracellular domain-containing protein n=1 Tax=Arthrobacter russicus TaxID=172040 RepID=A0ABU1JES1_9MICC|nr:hypothetical protein [Arthrobacter russicus]MDR6270361.1 hypothetical protein [Arthrobacter russicus]
MLLDSRSGPWKWAVIVVALLVVLGLVVAFFLGGALATGRPASPSAASSDSVGPASQAQPNPSLNPDLAALLPAKPLPGGLTMTNPGVLSSAEQASAVALYQALSADPVACLPLLPTDPGYFLIPDAPGQASYRLSGPGLDNTNQRIASGTLSEYTSVAAATAQLQKVAGAVPQCGQNVTVGGSQNYRAVASVEPLTVDTSGVEASCYNIRSTVSSGGASNNVLACHLRRQNIVITVMELSSGVSPSAEVLAQWTSIVQAQSAALAKLPA